MLASAVAEGIISRSRQREAFLQGQDWISWPCASIRMRSWDLTDVVLRKVADVGNPSNYEGIFRECNGRLI